MKVWEFAETIKLAEGNPRVVVEVETEKLKYKYGTFYGFREKIVKFAGINGWLSDVPAYLGGCDIKHSKKEFLENCEPKYTIYL